MTRFAPLFALWTVMMAVMMLPGAAPAIVRGARGVPRLGFAAAYLLVWTTFSAGAALVHGWLERAALLSDGMALRSSVAAGTILIAVGLYQLTPAKRGSLLQCRVRPAEVPASFGQSVMAGLRYGGSCLASSAALMALLFVAGVMSSAWMVAIALWIAGEKWLPWGGALPRFAGVGLVAWGGVMLALLPR
jgi:predicted metal-binding membrane protein